MFHRSPTKDVFDQLAEHDDPVDHETAAPAETKSGLEDAEGPEAPDLADTTEATAPDESPVERIRFRRIVRWLAATLGACTFVAAICLVGIFGWQLKQQRDIAAAGQTALSVGRDYSVLLTSIDNQQIDRNFDQVLDGATGEFKDMYSQSAAQLRQLLIDNKAVSHGTVVDAAIKSATKTRVEVLIFIDQSISNSVNPEPRIDRSRIALTMDLVDGRWLASKVDIK